MPYQLIFCCRLVEIFVAVMGDAFPELKKNKSKIKGNYIRGGDRLEPNLCEGNSILHAGYNQALCGVFLKCVGCCRKCLKHVHLITVLQNHVLCSAC